MNKKIVVIDDDQFDISMLRRGLEAAEIEIDVVSVIDSRSAVRVIRDENPDLAVVDLSMPHPNGFVVLAEVRADVHISHIKALILSGSTSVHDERKAHQLGANWYRVKPETLHGYRLLAAEISEFAAAAPRLE
ncbi:response regulator [Hoeflea sp. G2-23]|uniref:Response regulator n=1 Tax=Hoeflea algicola TaxID=2983763 RepID=A0ABT3Z3Y6_9HYPH|nr:response regulator [Hoeflea algicola]MCY0146358.1 response regulator [Hoeflea algicola]